MLSPTCLLADKSIPDPAADLKRARRIEQYRLSDRALYIPAGLRWSYLPLAEIVSAEESHRCVTAGKCVAVTEKRPTLLLKTAAESFPLPLEKRESLQLLLTAIRGEEGPSAG